jgi:FkbM family methyltransferase
MSCQVSVCIPTYRQPDLAARAVGSALEQVDCDLEVVVTDDSPDDEVRDRLALFQDPRLKYFKNERRLGAIGNWNEALRRSEGPIKKILHHDDWFSHRSCLVRFVEPIASGRTKIVFAACNALASDGSIRSVHSARPEQIVSLGQTPRSLVFGNFIGAPSVGAFHASLRQRFNPKYLWVSDIDFYIRLVQEAGGDFVYVDEPLVNVSTDLPSQISRLCERDWASSFYEHASLISELRLSGEERQHARTFLKDISSGLPSMEVLAVLQRSLRDGRVRLAVELIRLAGDRRAVTLWNGIMRCVKSIVLRRSSAPEPGLRGQESFAQCGEDLVVAFLFDAMGVKSGFYLDIGANHPSFCNNTLYFYQRGWRGVNVDPLPESISRFKVERPRDVNIQVGIGEKTGVSDFYRMSPDSLSTFNKDVAEAYSRQGHPITAVSKIKLLSAADLVTQTDIPRGLDLLSIDVESDELAVIAALLDAGVRPKVIICETLFYSRTLNECRKNDVTIERVQKLGYDVYADTFINTVFVERGFISAEPHLRADATCR